MLALELDSNQRRKFCDAILRSEGYPMFARILLTGLISTGLVCADTVPAITEAANRLEQLSAKAPAALRIEIRVMAAKALQNCGPNLARRFYNLAVDELRGSKDWQVGASVIEGLALIAPEDAISVLDDLPAGSSGDLIAALLQGHHIDTALSVYRRSLQHGDLQVVTARRLLDRLARENPSEASKLFREIIAAFPFNTAEPLEAFALVKCANSMIDAAPQLATEAYERIVIAASKPGFGDGKTIVEAKFQVGSQKLETKNTRDTLLVAAGSRLRKVAPEKFEKLSALFSQWNLSMPAEDNNVTFTMPHGPSPPVSDSAIDALFQRLQRLDSKGKDSAEAKATTDLATDIQALPPSPMKVRIARELFNLYEKGGISRNAVPAIAATLGQAIYETPAMAEDYLALATLVHYEHVALRFPDAALDSAVALLVLRDRIYEDGGFALRGIDGKTYSLAALRGRVVLLNFWATWCGPCRAEMPDMEKLYQAFEKKGLVVLAVSDEERDTVSKFIMEKKYTFPVLLDPGRKLHTAFDVVGIPQSFIFNREGQLTRHVTDSCKEEQFLQMLAQAGLD